MLLAATGLASGITGTVIWLNLHGLLTAKSSGSPDCCSIKVFCWGR